MPGLERGNVVEVGINRVAGRLEDFDLAQTYREIDESADSEQGEDANHELCGASGVHDQATASSAISSCDALPARKFLKSSSSAAITSATEPNSLIFPWFIKATRSEISKTSGTSWLTSTALRPNCCWVRRIRA